MATTPIDPLAEKQMSAVTVAAETVTAVEVAGWLRRGAVAIVPTETVYGLAIQPGNPDSAQRVFELKARPRDFNLPVVIGALEQLAQLGVDYNATARHLARRFWPGPLTLVMGFRQDVERPSWLTGRIEVAIRFPDMQLLRDVALSAGPILLTSANAHGTGAKMVAREAVESLRGAVDYVIDGGVLTPTPSTIVNVRLSPAVIERTGAVTEADLEEFIASGDVVAAQTP
ncbi:MAG TPA: L-threonylcarbamoyladenylate synthase [Thermoanaerobaculia bacterium]|nr:L-threonylcarbamoyladenylate synthase [Thermoanaerobaculia bacterium]